MRKVLLSVIACCAVIAVIPAAALARGDRHERHHHHHRGHHARIRHREFGGDQSAVNNQGENAGTVQSFTGGVLTIALNNGQTVSGQVTPNTEIECQAADMSSLSSHDRGRDNNGGDNNRGDDNGDNDQGDDRGQGEVDNDNDDQLCTPVDLTPGTVVHEAELKISSAGSVWDKVDLVSASAADNDND